MVGLVLVVAFMVAVALGLVLSTVKRHGSSPANVAEQAGLSFDSMNLYRPLRALMTELVNEIETSKDPTTKAMKSALLESIRHTDERAIKSLEIRDQLLRAKSGMSEAESEVQWLLEQRDLAETASVKLQLTQAYEARIGELESYQKVTEIVQSIEAEIELLRSGLNTLRAKLKVSSALSQANRSDDLRIAISSLNSLGDSVEEAQDFLRQSSQ